MIKKLVRKLCVTVLNKIGEDYMYNNENDINRIKTFERERRRKELVQTISKHIILKKC